MARGGVAVFPSDTVYGLCCDPRDAAAAARLYALKGRAPDKPAAVMFFQVGALLGELADLRPAERLALESLLPGPVRSCCPTAPGCSARPAAPIRTRSVCACRCSPRRFPRSAA